jgi:Family of unknown function (DUF5317)
MLVPIIVIVIALAVGLLAGGTLRGFEHVRLRWWVLAPLGLAMQAAPWQRVGLSQDAALALLIGSYPVLLVFLLKNMTSPGFPILFVGLALNLAVIAPNAGMPVSAGAIRSAGGVSAVGELRATVDVKHHVMTNDDVLRPLGDVIGIPEPWGEVMSVGDLLTYAGLAWWVLAAMQVGSPSRTEPLPAPRSRSRGYRGKHRPQALGSSSSGPAPPLRPVPAGRSGTSR